MSKLVVLKIGEGSFDQGYPVTLQIGEEGATPNVSLDGKLPPCAEIQPASVCLPIQYANWQWKYHQKLSSARMKKSSVQKTSYSDSALIDSSKILKQHLNDWLNSEAFRPIKDKFQQKINPDDIVRVIIQTDDPTLRRLPWYLWDLFASYRFAEVALYAPAFEGVKQSVQPKAKVRILAILGDASAPDRITGIKLDIEADKRFLESLPNAEIVFLVEPKTREFHDKLWDEKGWDILFFAGHSSSEPDGTTGKMVINPHDGLTIPELKSALQKAIERGLQLAIFNSCDGLGIARDLADLHIPHVIVMREPVPDLVAKEFLQHFLTFFAGGKSLYLAVREARERLQGLEKEIPCASWLPVICQNPAHLPPTWNDLRGVESGINWREVCQNALAERKKLTTNPLTTGDGVEFTFDHIYVPLGLVEKVKKEKRPGEISPEEGSQFYQPEEVTRTYKNDEFFAQVLKQGQSPKSQGRRLAVTGEPGAGKTTLLQKIAQWVATETEQDVAIWVSLADLQGRTVEEYLLQKWLKDVLGVVRVTPEMEEALASLFKSGRVWLLLDGVDEMGSSNPLGTVAAQISSWVASARVVVTCRQNVWDAGKNALEGFDVYRNLDFDYPEGVGQFIQLWFARHPELGERLLAELAQDGKERIRDTVRNPLRLALLCRAWQNRQGGLPETKAGLYKQFAKALYEWKQEKEKFHTNSQQRKDLDAALGRLALRGMEQSESRFRLREDLVTEILGETDEPLCQLALQLGWLNLVGVAVENPDERVYAFYHPTFQEYFAALAVDDWGYFLPKNHKNSPVEGQEYRIFQPQWKEVILLWFGRGDVQKDKKEAFLEKLVNFDDGCGSWNYPTVDKGFYEYRAYFLAGAIVPEFKDSPCANAIVSQIVDSCLSYMDSIKLGANAVLVETHKEMTIYYLIKLFCQSFRNSFFKKNILWNIGLSLCKIAVGNEQIINRLIQLLDKTSDEDILRRTVDILGEIAVGNEQAINRLIRLFEETSDSDGYIREDTSHSLCKIAVGNEQAINRLIRLFDETSDRYIRERISYIWGDIAVGNEQAINRLITLLDETSDEYTRDTVGYSLSDIAVGNEQAINRLITLLNETSDYDTYWKVAKILGEIAVGNEQAINRLILMLDKTSNKDTSNKDTRWSAADILGEIAVGNEQAINRLIQLLDGTSDEDTRGIITEILGKIAVGNEQAINRLIQLLDETSDEDTCYKVADSLGIAVGNEGAINRLIQLLEETYYFDTVWCAASSLGKIAVGNEQAINRLIKLIDEHWDEDNRKGAVDALGEIAVGNEQAINRLLQLLEQTSDYDTRWRVADSLGKISRGNEGVPNGLIRLLDETPKSPWIHINLVYSWGKIVLGNEQAINCLLQLLEQTSDYSIRTKVAEILGEIAVGNEQVINRLITLLNQTSNYNTRTKVVDTLGEIAVGNEQAINRLIQLLNQISNKDVRKSVADILGKIIETKQQYYQLVVALKYNLTDEINQNNFYLYQKFYSLIWQCAQNLTYPEFYGACHHQLTSTHPEAPDNIPVGNTVLTQSLETQINDILSQLQPTPQTYPLPINIQSLVDETDTSAICQELCTLIYSLTLPDTDIPTVSNFAQLKQQILTAKKQLQKRHLALILHNCKPHPPLLTCCRKIADANLGLHILWITDEPLEAPLHGFPPSLDNLLGALQTWLEEF